MGNSGDFSEGVKLRKQLWGRLFVDLVCLFSLAYSGGSNRISGRADPAQNLYLHQKALVEAAFGSHYFDNNKEREKALHWMVYEDPLEELTVKEDGGATANRFIQRFILVSFYFQSSFQNPWTNCNPPLDAQSSTCYHAPKFAALLKNKQREEVGTRWLSATHECEWMGVFCGAGSKLVTDINMSMYQLLLFSSCWLHCPTNPFVNLLGNNNLSGTLPAQLSRLSHLANLQVEFNHLSGSLPQWVATLPELQRLSFCGNELTGSIPSEYFSLPKLRGILLDQNLLGGALPQTNYSLGLSFVSLQNNSLTGFNSTPNVFTEQSGDS